MPIADFNYAYNFHAVRHDINYMDDINYASFLITECANYLQNIIRKNMYI